MSRTNLVVSTVWPVLFLASALGLYGVPAQARTWIVTKAGNGDFLVIQEAVDAAADGDTIMIAAGRYVDFTVIHAGTEINYVRCIDKGLTFIGAGAEATIIGQANPDYIAPQVRQEGILCNAPGSDFRFRGIGFENLRHGKAITVYGESMELEECTFVHCSWGVLAFLPGGGVVRNCEFNDIGYWPDGTSGNGVAFSQPTVGVVVENCLFTNCLEGVGSYWDGTQNITVLNCRFIGGRVGVSFVDRASGVVKDCYLEGHDVFGVAGSEGGTVLVEDNEIVTNFAGGGASGFGTFFPGGDYTLRRNAITSSNGNFCVKLQQMNFQFQALNNHFVREDTLSYTCVATAFSYGPYYVDVSNNWWGTTDLQEIRDGILDLHDDPERRTEFNFEPILDQPVGNEQKSLGSLKMMFR